ncbi:DNA/RNA-binding protein KIN17, putative [Plasmodium vinckei brucechwatti]|uniref:DNA/RNA-binding protein KIN17, putative n=1 Tax=Plasmodium vinckei brucechwatti TaxID=119398 RepID=A0A6V7SP17_PLAVN|nr:DNA/RNA-binding protein KIN17, putative [Plasmodium vinckei brucechwatti]
MPRAEPGTPKWLANKMKAKGLQKLKWYCQMCEKQCRDENGFKCHRLSETHQRQMQIFCQDANKFMDEYSSMFEKEFMRLMKTKYCRTRILANTVYTNMISDKTHIHMNATVWVTLTDFVLYLGKTGKCKIEQTERGWYLEYIDREKIEREKAFNKKKKIEYSYEEMKEKKINEVIEEAKKTGQFIQSEYTGIEKKNNEKIIISSVKAASTNTATAHNDGTPKSNIFLDILKQNKIKSANDQLKAESIKKEEALSKDKSQNKKRPMSSLELLIMENEEKKKLKNILPNLNKNINVNNSKVENTPSITNHMNENHDKKKKDKNNEDYDIWITKNIMVKIIDKNHKYYKSKGVITSISSNEKNKCEIKIKNTSTYTSAYQKQIQTVIPQIGRTVLILKGQYKGLKGKLKKISEDEDYVVVSVFRKSSDEIIAEERMLFDDISKFQEE